MFFKTKQREERQAMLDILKAMQEVSKMQAEVMARFLKGFEITGPPEVRVMTDEDEARMEREAQAAKADNLIFPAPDFYTALSMD